MKKFGFGNNKREYTEPRFSHQKDLVDAIGKTAIFFLRDKIDTDDGEKSKVSGVISGVDQFTVKLILSPDVNLVLFKSSLSGYFIP